MGEGREVAGSCPDPGDFGCPELKLTQLGHLDHLEGDGVSVQCVNSSEFVVGKQTNFNGPVTIINCENIFDHPLETARDAAEEKIVIRDKVLSRSAVAAIQERAGKGEKTDGGEEEPSEWRRRWSGNGRLLLAAPFLILLVGTAVALGFYFVPQESSEDEPAPRHRIYSKGDWGGLPPTSAIEMKLPVPYVVISHSVTPRCFALESCAALIRSMQSYHFSRDYADIAYNFMVDSAGNVYEGRGWANRNVKGGLVSGRSLNVNLIGDFSREDAPTEDQLDGARHLIERGLEEGKISRNYLLLADNATSATLSPGRNVYSRIKHWPHFEASPAANVPQFEER